jgi:5-methylcytosine-specific restriction endonuclease McrA
MRGRNASLTGEARETHLRLKREEYQRNKLARNAASARRYAERRSEINEANKARYHAHPEKGVAYRKAKYPQVRAKKIADAIAWAQANPDRRKVIYERRRAAKLGTVNTLTTAEWVETLDYFGGACGYCGRSDVPMTMDHMTPFHRGGAHDSANVIPACKSCNCSKKERGILIMVNAKFTTLPRL